MTYLTFRMHVCQAAALLALLLCLDGQCSEGLCHIVRSVAAAAVKFSTQVLKEQIAVHNAMAVQECRS